MHAGSVPCSGRKRKIKRREGRRKNSGRETEGRKGEAVIKSYKWCIILDTYYAHGR